jgi:hypothetical protein
MLGRLPKTAARLWLALAVPALLSAPQALAQLRTASRVTTPLQALGFTIGDDYHLATYTQFVDYWNTLEAESPRLVVEEIGTTAEGRPQYMAVITSPENHASLVRYKDIARRLALVEAVTDEQARQLATEGKAVVWIDGGLHATEVLGAHQLMELVYQMVSRDDAETLRILDDVIILAVHANPDGMELVSNWYMREPEPEKRSTRGVPRLYQKYIGHDNNRDFYMVTQPETENMARVMFREWFPQIIYNHHQSGPAGTVMFAPPFRDPFNYNFDPLVWVGTDMVGTAMHHRFIAEGKPGTTMRGGAGYSTWWNGGLRTTAYFHNQIALLTETIGNPTPTEIPLLPDRQLPSGDLPYPIEPQPWHFRQSIDYSITANRAVLDYASRYRETVLFNIYRMGKNSIERGSRDHWTVHPTMIDAVKAAAKERETEEDAPAFLRRWRGIPKEHFSLLRDPADRDPRGYVLPSSQRDFATATKFVNTLIKTGITIHRATRDFEIAGKAYPAGSYVVEAAQAFRPHIMDMFEPQDHPNDFEYEGGPPIRPYDNAGWTLAYLMGVEFDRVLEGFDGPFRRIEGFASVPQATITRANGAVGFLLSHRVNDAFVVTNRLLKGNHDVYWLTQSVTANGKNYPAGTIYVPASAASTAILRQAAAELGIGAEGVAETPGARALQMRPVRIGLWDRYGGSMPSGWTRWLLEQFEFPFETVFPPILDEGNLRAKYDVLVFPTGAITMSDREDAFRPSFGSENPEQIPPEYRSRLGRVTSSKTVPQLKRFLEDGGTIIAIGSSTAIAHHLGLPVANHLTEEDDKPLSRDEYYIPGSVLEAKVNLAEPLAYGLPERVTVFFDNSPVLRLLPEAVSHGVKPIAWFDSAAPLRSGWAWGQHYLKGGTAIAEAQYGSGAVFLFGPEILHRAQPHGTFKFFFNAIRLAGASRASRTAAMKDSN